MIPVTLATATRTILRQRNAMNTLFEARVRHDDVEHAEAAADAALDEIVRVDGVLSRFDRTAEVYRVNREASAGTAAVSVELIELLDACRDASERTGGAFDLTAVSRRGGAPARGPAVEIDVGRRRVRFTRPGVFLDFGGCGKGFAVDRAAAVLRAAGATNWLVHGGTSSVAASGSADDDGTPWSTELRDPFVVPPQVARPVPGGTILLSGRSLSSSAHRHRPTDASDLIVPASASPLRGQAACAVVAAGRSAGFVSEVLSTALLVAGRRDAEALLSQAAYADNDVSAAWVEPEGGSARLVWLGKAPRSQGT